MSKELPTRASKEDRRLINDRIAREEAEEITREQGKFENNICDGCQQGMHCFLSDLGCNCEDCDEEDDRSPDDDPHYDIDPRYWS